MKDNLKRYLCNKLIKENLVQEGDCIRHSYTISRMNGEMKDIKEKNVSPTLDTRCDCLGVVVNDMNYVSEKYKKFIDKNGYIPDMFCPYNECEIKDCAKTITTQCGSTTSSATCLIKENEMENNLRIRKLTPKECFRLMGVKDEDSDKLNHLSNATKYHLAGDSIVVNVLQAIFKSILIDNPVVEQKPIRLIEFFAGYGSQALALKYLGIPFEHWKTCEWAVKSINAYRYIHFPNEYHPFGVLDIPKEELIDFLYKKGISSNWNEPLKLESIKRMKTVDLYQTYEDIYVTNNLVNIQQVHAEDLEIKERDDYNYLLTYSFPCFTKDSLVLTQDGYKCITDVKIGERVLTHKNRYKNVTNVFDNGIHDIYKINAMSVDEIKATGNHRFYIREMYRKGHFSTRCFKEPVWKELKDLTKKDYLGIPVNQYSIVPHFKNLETDNEIFWWLIGRYIGDGWYKSNDSIIICCGKNELDEITSRISSRFKYNVYEERTVYKIYINEKDIGKFVLQFGQGAINKHLTDVIMDLPNYLLEYFLKGYFSADGCKVGKTYKATTISRELAYGMGSCIAKVYHTPYRIYKSIRPKKCIIEGRVVNQHDTYQIVFKKEKCKQDKAFYEDDYIWYPIKNITYVGTENVYDIEVEDDHSFTVQNTIVHNCQDLSLAGKTAGMKKGSGTRSGMLWEVERILEECGEELPQILLMENVPQVVGKKNKEDFDNWVSFLESKGYTNNYCMLNAKEVGYPEPIPQNRNRCFMISVLNPKCDIVFPEKTERKTILKDLLEEQVDEKYYLSDSMINYIKADNEKWTGNNDKAIINKSVASTLNTNEGCRRCDASNYISNDVEDNYNLKIKNATKQGYLEATDGDGVDISSRMQYHRGNVQKDMIQTITTSGGTDRGVVVKEDKWGDLD